MIQGENPEDPDGAPYIKSVEFLVLDLCVHVLQHVIKGIWHKAEI